ncbi:MAG: hypothetical protein FWE91_09005 [Defluviitaleaceae bacterium]|nr:hypothetical protein [Defluviitaleaceae bacterium]MCL2837190.1 hypothetical protein [Defluviitaleaceae bacterium]
MMDGIGFVFNDMIRHIGQTVTIFTTSGGLSGGGFTGVLISVDNCVVRLLACEGAPPCCPVGSACWAPNSCDSGWGGWGGIGLGWGNGWGNGSGFDGFNPMGGVVVIPTHAIAAFVHHAI